MPCLEQKCDRRAFLANSIKSSTVMCLSCALPVTIASCLNNPKEEDSPDFYYALQKEKLLKEYEKSFEPGQAVLAKTLEKSAVRNIIKEAIKEYENTIPDIPYIGGEENKNSTSQLLEAAQYLALYRTLTAHGKKIPEIGQVIYDMFEARLQASPKFIVSIWGYFKFHVGRSENIEMYSEMSQKRKYSMDFVYTFIEGDGKTLDYGVDMTECAVQKFFREQKAEELVPYICVLDYSLSKRFNRGLIRTKTLVESNVCDFRYKKDRKTQINFPPGLKV